MGEEENDKPKIHRSATSKPTPNITKVKTVNFFRIVTGERMWMHRYSPDKKNAIHSIETFKIACK
jgi:hypothetical protein